MDSSSPQENILIIAISCPKFMDEDRCQQLIDFLWVIQERVMLSKKITQIFPYLLPGKDLRNFQGTFKKSLEDTNAATFICDTLAEESIGETRNTTHMFNKLADLIKEKNQYSFLIISDGKFNFEPFKFPLRKVDHPFNATVLHIVEKPEKIDTDISFPSYCYAMFSRLKFDNQYIMEDIPTGLVSKKNNNWSMNKYTDAIFSRIVEDNNSSSGVRFPKDKKERETFDDFIKTIISTDTKYIPPVIKDVNIKPRVQSMVDSEKDESNTTVSEGIQQAEEEKHDEPQQKPNSGLDMVDNALEKLTSEYNCKTIKLEDDLPKDAKAVFVFLHLSMNIPESKEKKCLELKEAYGTKLKILYTRLKESRVTWQKLSPDKFKDVVHPTAIEYKMETPGNKKNLDQKEFANTMRNLLAATK